MIELLIVVAIVGTLVAFLLPAVQKVRDAAARTRSQNNLKQVLVAAHHFAQVNGGFLPNVNGYNYATQSKDFSLFLSLMPYLEQGALYAAYKAKYQGGSSFVVRVLLSPADSTLPPSPTGVSSYAANAVLFGPSPTLAGVTDGASNTVAFAEHYAYNCGGAWFSWFYDASPFYLPATAPGGLTVLRAATFADAAVNDVVPAAVGGPPATGASTPGLTFQVKPAPPDCNPRVAQTPHGSGMVAGLCDGSVRTLAPGMSEATYWGALTPAGGETPGDDW